MSYKHYYVVIIGSGPAGLGVANVLMNDSFIAPRTLIIEKGSNLKERTCAVREGKPCKSCQPCNIISGVGGAGPYTDGKICLYQQDLKELFLQSEENGDNEEINKIIDGYLDRVKKIWMSYGVRDFKEIKVDEKMELLESESIKESIDYICYPVLHIGSDGARKVITRFIKSLLKSGIKIEVKSNVTSIEKIDNEFLITYEIINDKNITEKKVKTDFLVLALGRYMQKPNYINKIFKNIKLNFQPKDLEIGCRVEVPYQIMEEIIKITFDPKFIIITPTYEDYVRTFCTCHRGKIVREGLCVNGHIDKTSLTENTNFAFLVKYPLNFMRIEDAMDYGNTIAKLTLSQGKGKPIIQRLGDLKKGIHSTAENIKKSYIKPTLRRNWHVIPGDIASCYPSRIIVDLLEGLEILDKVIKGVNNDQNLLYAPEIKPTCSITLKDGVRTEIPDLYVCGDFSGYTRGIAQAMCMGMMVGEDILNKVKEGFQLRIV